MNKALLILTLLSSLPTLHGQTFVDKTITIGDTFVTFPIPAQYVQLERNMPMAKDFFVQKEHAFVDETKNNTFIIAAITPEKFTEAGKNGRLSGTLDCWAMYPNFSTHSRINLTHFAGIIREFEEALKKSRKGSKFIDVLDIKTSELDDSKVRKSLESIEKPDLVSKSSRTLVMMTKAGDEYILNAYCIINGKLLLLYLQKKNPFDGIEEMQAWTKEIEAKTTAEFNDKGPIANSGWRSVATVSGLLLMTIMAIAALFFAFKSKPPTT